jgi:hypothetical protein
MSHIVPSIQNASSSDMNRSNTAQIMFYKRSAQWCLVRVHPNALASLLRTAIPSIDNSRFPDYAKHTLSIHDAVMECPNLHEHIQDALVSFDVNPIIIQLASQSVSESVS